MRGHLNLLKRESLKTEKYSKDCKYWNESNNENKKTEMSENERENKTENIWMNKCGEN